MTTDTNLIFQSAAVQIGKTTWILQVIENTDAIIPPSLSRSGEFEHGTQFSTRYQWHDGQAWRSEKEHPRYDFNNGTTAGLPKGLADLYKRYEKIVQFWIRKNNHKETQTMNNKTTQDARALSSGTIASLIDCTSYAIIDVVQNVFIEFCRRHEGEFEDWVQAWHAFAAGAEVRLICPACDRTFSHPRNLYDETTHTWPINCPSCRQYSTVPGEGAPQYTFLPKENEQLSLL